MKKITEKEFFELVQEPYWKHETYSEVLIRGFHDVIPWDGNRRIMEHISGLAYVMSHSDDMTITFSEKYKYIKNKPDSLETGIEEKELGWTIAGIIVVDEEGNRIDSNKLCCDLPDSFLRTDYSLIELDLMETRDVDVDTNIPFDPENEKFTETFVLKNDYNPDVRFTGERLGHTRSYPFHPESETFSGVLGHWSELELYRTIGNHFICHRIDYSNHENESTLRSVAVCESLDQVQEFFGDDNLANYLWHECGGMETLEEMDGATAGPGM